MTLPSPTPWQARIIWLAITGLAIALLVTLAAVLIWGLGKVLNILSPVIWPLIRPPSALQCRPPT